jgi:hypothetical protein
MPLRVAFFCCLVISAALLASCWEGLSREVRATVLSVRGEVVCGTEGQNDFPPVTLQTMPSVGSVVRALDNAQVDFSFLSGTLVRVSGNSELKIEQLRLTKDGNKTEDGILDRVVVIQLNRGKISALFELRDESASRFTIRTRHATISAGRNCLFQIQAEDAKTRVTCARGKVYVEQGNRRMSIIAEGYFQEWPSNGPAAIAASDDARGQIDITDVLEAEQELSELQSRQRDRRPF